MPPSHPGAPAARSLLTSGATRSLRKTVPPPWQRPGFSRCLTTEERSEMLEDQKKRMSRWLMEKGENFRRPVGRPNYLGSAENQPFPQNAAFRSQPVLSQEAKEKIWTRVMIDGQPLKAVSAELGVDLRRVAAVVRLQEVEARWKDEGKPLALPYARAVMQMLPQNSLEPTADGKITPHESISDIHVHSWTTQQVFWPTSESRHFTREDAAKAFHERMLPADRRVAHTELIKYEKDLAGGVEKETAWLDFVKATAKAEQKAASIQERKERREEEKTSRAMTKRFEFRFRDINIDDVGPTGRSRKGTGARYGVPFYDRRRGEVKIPTKAE